MRQALTNRKAAGNVWQTILIGSLMLWVLVLSSDAVNRFITGKEPVNHLRLESIEFKEGHFHQLVIPERGGVKPASWSASIYQGSKFICGGSGRGAYGERKVPAIFTPDEWAGDDCPGLTVGEKYQGRATWTYWGVDNQNYEISVIFDFIYSEAE